MDLSSVDIWSWQQWLSISCLAVFSYLVVGVFVVFFIPMPMRLTRWVCNTGVSLSLVASVNAMILYYWQHYFR